LTHIAGSGADWRATVCSRGRAEPVDCRAVILATGGYDYDADRRRRWLPGPITALGSVPENVGDGLTIAERLGARIRNLHAGWWMPMIKVPGELVGGQPYSRGLVRERGAPRQIIVDDRGERFVDEASPYHEFVTAMIRRDESGDYPHGRAYMVFDSVFHQRYPLPGMVGQAVPPPWVGSAPDLIGLGRAIGVDGAALMASVRRWNDMCAGGADSDFGRGESTYDKYFGDPVVTPNPAMGPIEVPPFYAVQVHAGCIGTKGGPETDMDGQLLDMGGEPIPGVYAAGNASAFWTADGYPGPGATLAAAMTFGYRAGKHAVAA
jgi:3-oxosteroid 1-dehydrogenase